MMRRLRQLARSVRHEMLVRLDPARSGSRPALSYSQCGEDLIVDFVLRGMLGVETPHYLDIGAHDPVVLNNTYGFYRRGSRGVCVEPNPKLGDKIRAQRPRDRLVNAGVAAESGSATYFEMDVDTLNTFSSSEAQRYAAEGHAIIAERQLPLRAINDVLSHACERCPDMLSLDIEAGELEILQAWDFARFRPKVMCVETLTYAKQRRGEKVTEVIELICSQGYWVYADTFINTIFIDEQAWRSQPSQQILWRTTGAPSVTEHSD